MTRPAAAWDLDGDGRSEVALSRLGYDEPAGGRGRVFLLSPSADGLRCFVTLTGDAYEFGFRMASGDFDADGYADVAVGSPFDGKVDVFRGGSRGPHRTAVTRLRAPVDPRPGGDREFGIGLAAADFDHDGYADLAVGAPVLNDGSRPHHSYLEILRGGPGGLVQARGRVLRAPRFPNFGEALAAGDVNGDGFPDLLESTLTIYGATPRLLLLPGGPTGPSKPVVVGRAFGAVTVGDLTGDGTADVVIAEPCHLPRAQRKMVGSPTFDYSTACQDASGRISVRVGSTTGLGDPVVVQPGRDGLPGSPEPADQFGGATAVVPGQQGRPGSLVVSAMTAQSGQPYAGAVYVVPATRSGLDPSRARELVAGRAGFPGRPAESAFLGEGIIVRDLAGDGQPDALLMTRRIDAPGNQPAVILVSDVGTAHEKARVLLRLERPIRQATLRD